MSHEPECHFIDISYGRTLEGICICHPIRAAEQRRDRENAPAVIAMCNDEYASGYSDALDETEAAVAELTEKGDSVRPADVMVAIRALKEKP